LEDKRKLIDEALENYASFTIEPDPYFYTRLSQKLDKIESGESPFIIKLLKPIFITLLICLAVIGGVFIGTNQKSDNTVNDKRINSIMNTYYPDTETLF